MTRIKRGFVAKKRRKNILLFTKGFIGAHSKLFRIANQQMMKSLRYAFFDRRKKKNENKSIWIIRMNASGRLIKIKYNKIINLFKDTTNIVNRKNLSETIINTFGDFWFVLKNLFRTLKNESNMKITLPPKNPPPGKIRRIVVDIRKRKIIYKANREKGLKRYLKNHVDLDAKDN
jgi:large subunit ribosomal protein L20